MIMQNFVGSDNQLFYEPIPLKGLNKRINAWFRCIVWGYCPLCNSDAPAIDTCFLCQGDRNTPLLEHKRKTYWNLWKYFNYKGKI